MSDVENKDNYILFKANETNIEYSIRWAKTLNGPKQKFKACLILIDNEINCNQKLEQTTQYIVDTNLKTKITKAMPAKKLEAAKNINRDECEKELFLSQIENLNTKVKEQESTIEKQLEKISNLEKRIESQNKTISTKNNEIDSINKNKLMSIATCIFNNFGTISDIQSLIVVDDTEDEMVSFI